MLPVSGNLSKTELIGFASSYTPLLMNFFKNIFGKKAEPVKTYADFWNWFQQHEKKFFRVVQRHTNIDKDFFRHLSPKLDELKEGYFFVTGMYDDCTAELILTAQGNIRNFVFVEELVRNAPEIKGWKFTALAPSLDIQDVNIEMEGYKFNRNNLNFYSTDLPEYPDEIDITVVHDDYEEQNKSQIEYGVHLFLDNYLGELGFATKVDNLNITGRKDAQQELIPIEKLKDFLNWREKEFVERYESASPPADATNFTIMEAKTKSGILVIATINTDLLGWDEKVSHPWVAIVDIKFDGTENKGLPDPKTNELLYDLEDRILQQLKAEEGDLYIGRQTTEGVRKIYFACRDFRKSSRVFYELSKGYLSGIDISYTIYRDKYWQTFNKFRKR